MWLLFSIVPVACKQYACKQDKAKVRAHPLIIIKDCENYNNNTNLRGVCRIFSNQHFFRNVTFRIHS